MRALLLAAGKATRLGHLSQNTPKCLHEIGGELLIDRLIRQLRDAGVEEFLVNTHHLSDKVETHLQGRSDRDRISILYEPQLLGTLGTLKAAASYFGGQAGWVLHADNFIEGGLGELKTGFLRRPPEVWGTMLTYRATDPRTCGVIEADAHGVVTGFFEKIADPPTNQASAATFIFDHRVFELVGSLPMAATNISVHLLPLLLGRLSAVEHSSSVIDIGTVAGLCEARALAKQGM